MKIVEGTGYAAKLENIFEGLEEQKHALADLADTMEEDGRYAGAVEMIFDSLESIDSALDALRDAMDGMG